MINLSRVLCSNNTLIEKLISNFNNDTLHNSLVFSGPKGIGKATLAFFFMNKIFKSLSLGIKINNTENLIYNISHPNIKYVCKQLNEKNEKSKNFITIDQIRNLNNFLYQSSFNHLPKFVIIDSADELNINSSNSLLKILEEPKDNTYFILITHQLSNLLPTIRSRCIKFNIKIPNIDQFINIIKLHEEHLDESEINFLYYLSNGSPGLAIEVNSDKLKYLFQNIIKILHINNNQFSSELIALSDLVGKYTNEEFKIFLIVLRFIMLSIIKIKFGLDKKNYIFSYLLKYFSKYSININNINSLEILEFLDENEKNLFTYNLDKRIFFLSIFNPLLNKL